MLDIHRLAGQLGLVRVLAVLSSVLLCSVASGSPLGRLPVQDGGRIKPFDTLAREALALTYGRETYGKGSKEKRSAEEVVLTWMLIPEQWDKTEFILVRHSGLREALNLSGGDKKRMYFSPEELLANDRLRVHLKDLRSRQGRREKLNPFYQAVQKLETQLTVYHAIRLQQGLRVVPAAEGETWLSVSELDEIWAERFRAMTSAFVAQITGGEGSASALKEAVDTFTTAARAEFGDRYGSQKLIDLELQYNRLIPFVWSWVFYLLAGIFVLYSLWSSRRWLIQAAWASVAIAVGFHLYGFALRVMISGRPPVTNMYETVVWVGFGAIVFGAILELIYRHRFSLLGGTLVAGFCLVLAGLAPAVLDESIHPLEPVLRDNFWLSTHVLITVLSYAAFFLAFLIGDILLIYFLREEKYREQIAQGQVAIYRSFQIGVVLLAAGTILGGIWADYSWGRFWGWDPKETWALIALLGYLAVLHGRLVGWVSSFGMAALAVVTFSLVIMAWYGVNFVLGAGLHTYGFGAGGVEWVAGFVAIHLLFVVFVAVYRANRLKGKSKGS